MAPKTPQKTPSKRAEKATSKKDSNIALSLLSRAHSPTTANTIFTEKIKTRPLYLKSTVPSSNAQQTRRLERERKLSRKKKLKPAPLSSRQKRALCIYDIPRSSQKYAIYAPLHRMWISYIQEVLGDKCMPVTAATAAKLCSADYHGAELEVVRSRCVSRVGVKGIVVKDSKFVFEIVTERDMVKVVPKEHTIFRFTIPAPKKKITGAGGNATIERESGAEEESVGDIEMDVEEEKKEDAKKDLLVFELHGDQFIYRAADRANRKFKSHFLPDL